MDIRWLGAGCILLSCGGFGFYLSFCHKKEEQILMQFLNCLDYMEWELLYRLTPLVDLCRQVSGQTGGSLGTLFIKLAEELESQISPDVAGCMQVALALSAPLPKKVEKNLKLFGKSLGRYDLDGQLKGLDSVRTQCRRDLKELEKNREEHQRIYQTLGLCAGAALVILFI